jgi:5-methyltetrahydropteroyltriglutamate--homocysteine methyltransferase
MILSRDRILATHVGSLPRSEALSEMLIDREEGKPLDEQHLADEMDRAVRHVIAKQAEAGIDVGNDGEQQRVGFQTYVPRRMAGFAGESKRRRGRDFEEFPALVEDLMRRFPKRSRMQNAPEAQAELQYHDSSALTQEIDRFQKNVKAAGAFAESFMTAPSPGIISTTMLNAYYDSQQSYLTALAREMRNEYLSIYRAGLLLQIDSPDLAMDRSMFYRDLSDGEFVKAAEMHVAALNQAIDGIPRDRVRLHCCWGNWNGPHLYDVALDLILPVLYQANVGALSIEFGNPRHQHELEALRRNKLPDHMLLLPGVVESNSNIVEHPEVVARRLEEAVAAVGDRERVVASADCGFGTFTNREYVIEPVVWLKLKALRQGADIASTRLWGRSAAS